jgi:long-chain acyl-CoA synthetase
VLLRDRVRRWSDKTFLRYRRGDIEEQVTWRDFEVRVGRIARHLIQLGVEAEHRIAVLSENRVEMFMFDLAAMSIGAVTIPIFAGYPSQQVSYVLGHSRPRFVVVSGFHQLEKIDRQANPWVERFYCMDFGDPCAGWGAEPFDGLLAEGGADEEAWNRRIANVGPDDLCIIMYTSGTTGPPKGVKLTHRNIISQQRAIEQIWDISDQDVLMCYLPWHHSFGGLFERTMGLYHGIELCLDDSRGRDIDRLIQNWRLFRPTVFFSVPRVHDLLLSRCRERREIADVIFGDGRLRFVFTAGASLPAAVAKAYRQLNIPVLEGWGLTETSPCCTATTKDSGWHSGCVGFPIPGVTIRIDSDQEILVKGPNVMAGYLDDEEATSRVIDDDGWFHTGDLGEFGSDGLRLVGRKDGAFKLTTGEKVHPQRVETVLVNESPFISQAVAVGRGKDFVGALIYPDRQRLEEWARSHAMPTASLVDEPAVRELFAAELVRINPLIEVKYQRVRRAVLAEKEPSFNTGELTPSGKLVRKVVNRLYKDKIDAMYKGEPYACVIEVEQPLLQRTTS